MTTQIEKGAAPGVVGRKVEPSLYEKTHGVRARSELMEHLPELFESLDEANFHRLYDLAWSLSTEELLHHIARDRVRELEAKLAAKGADE